MITQPDFDTVKYTESIEGTVFIREADIVPEKHRKAVRDYVRAFNDEAFTAFLMGGDSE